MKCKSFIFLVLAFALSLIFVWFILGLPQEFNGSSHGIMRSPVHDPSKRKAFVTFFAFLEPKRSLEEGLKDPYFMCGRLLISRLLRHPDTRTRLPDVEVVALVTESVGEVFRQILRDDGAIVVPIPKYISDLTPPYEDRAAIWLNNTSLSNLKSDKWRDQFNKLYLWAMTEYDRVVYIDNDIWMFQNIDDIFTVAGDSPFMPFPEQFLSSIGRPIFTGGFFTLIPDKEVLKNLSAHVGDYKQGKYSLLFMEQSFLNYMLMRNTPRLPTYYLSRNFDNANQTLRHDFRMLHGKFWTEASPMKDEFQRVIASELRKVEVS